jgi:hypothetical protein
MISTALLQRLVLSISAVLFILVLVPLLRWYTGGFGVLPLVSASIPLLLGLMGIFVALHEEWAKRNKLLVSMTFVLVSTSGFVVTTALDRRARAETANAQMEAQKANDALTVKVDALNLSTAKIKEIGDLNTDLQKQLIGSSLALQQSNEHIGTLSADTLASSKETFENIMGTGSVPLIYPFEALTPITSDPSVKLPLFIVNTGRHFLTSVTVFIHKWPPSTAEEIFKAPELAVGTVRAGFARPLSEGVPVPREDHTDAYEIMIHTQNASFEEILEVRQSKKGFYEHRYKVSRITTRLVSREFASLESKVVIAMTDWSGEKPLFEIGP